MKIRLVLIMSLVWLLGATMSGGMEASAHINVRSNSAASSAVIHVNPNDDPIAGDETIIFFDINSQTINNSSHRFRLLVKDMFDGSVQYIEPSLIGERGVRAVVTFEHRGEYGLRLEARNAEGGGMESFEFNQFVNRGTSSRAQGQSGTEASHYWAELGLVIDITFFIAILIVLINRRKYLAEYIRLCVMKRG